VTSLTLFIKKIVSIKTNANAFVKRNSFSSFSLQDPPQSSSATSYAVIDGLSFSIKAIRIRSNGGQSADVVLDYNKGPKTFQIGASTQTLPINDTMDFSVLKDPYNTSFLGFDILTPPDFSVKGFCKTNTNLLYTSATGIKSVPLSLVNSLPTDYDYASSDTTGVEKGMFYTQTIYYNQLYDFTLNNSITNIKLQMDNSYLFKCWDGKFAFF
jgi:hypothetical protein